MAFFEGYLMLFAFGAAALTVIYYMNRPSEPKIRDEKNLKPWVSLQEMDGAAGHEKHEEEYEEAA